MELQEEMFALIAEGKTGDITKHAFSVGRPISLSKFNYWCAKYNHPVIKPTIKSR